MSKVIAGIFTLVGGLMTIYFTFVMINSSWYQQYGGDVNLHQSMYETGHLPALMVGVLMLIIGLVFFFVAKEPNLK